MNQALSTYLAQDRLRALAHYEMLPDHTSGSALFADISGFTPLTEKLTQQFGARRGIEQLTQRINTVYDLTGLAGVVISHDRDASRAAQLAGAGEALRAASEVSPSPFERGVYGRTVAAAKLALGDQAFNAAFEAGQKMTLEEAVKLALEENQAND
jgi:hypothetical protein